MDDEDDMGEYEKRNPKGSKRVSRRSRAKYEEEKKEHINTKIRSKKKKRQKKKKEITMTVFLP